MTKPTESTKATPSFTLLEGKAIESKIVSIQSNGKTLDSDIHLTAISILNHVQKHGDVTLATKLFDALPNSGRRQALKAWFVAMGKMDYKAKTKKEEGMFVYNKDKTTYQAQGEATPFWDFTKERDFSEFDVGLALERLLKRVQDAAKDERNHVPVDSITSIRELTEKYKVKPTAKAA